MARTKPRIRIEKRISWTRFYLPRGQEWPIWSSTSHSKAQPSPLAGVTGVEKVWLGRKVDDPEQAALIILWESSDPLKNFQNSPACAEFLQGLPANDVQASLLFGSSLQDPSLSDAPLSSAAPSSRFLTLQWTCAHDLQENLQGRITLTAVEMPYSIAISQPEWRNTVYTTLGYFLPTGFKGIRSSWLMDWWTAWALVDSSSNLESQPGQQDGVTTVGIESDRRAIACQFRRWDGYGGGTPKHEEALAKCPLARESWQRKVAEVMPPVTDWEQQRWDLQLAPRYVFLEKDGEEGGRMMTRSMSRRMKEFEDLRESGSASSSFSR